jgi:hypothetical protein
MRICSLLARTSGMSDEELKADLEQEEAELETLKTLVEEAREEVAQAKTAFDLEEKKPENSKKEGQPLRHQFEQILKKYKINFADFHGRDMQGPACMRLLNHRDEIILDLQEFVLGLPPDQKRETDDNATRNMFELHRQLMGHIDAVISFLRTKRFHLSHDSMEVAALNADKHAAQMMNLWRYLGLNESPKLHCAGCHAVSQCKKRRGIGDMGEDAGERAHQTETKNERRLQCMINRKEKEVAKARFEFMQKKPTVVAIQKRLFQITKRNFKDEHRETAEDRQEEARRARQERRDALLSLPMYEGSMETLRQRKEARLIARNDEYMYEW